MDEKRNKIKKYIEEADIPAELKAKELEIVADESLSTPEVEMALAQLIGEEFDTKAAEAGVTDIPADQEVEDALKAFESESELAEKDFEEDMKLVEESFKAISETSEEIQKAALQVSLNADKE